MLACSVRLRKTYHTANCLFKVLGAISIRDSCEIPAEVIIIFSFKATMFPISTVRPFVRWCDDHRCCNKSDLRIRRGARSQTGNLCCIQHTAPSLSKLATSSYGATRGDSFLQYGKIKLVYIVNMKNSWNLLVGYLAMNIGWYFWIKHFYLFYVVQIWFCVACIQWVFMKLCLSGNPCIQCVITKQYAP